MYIQTVEIDFEMLLELWRFNTVSFTESNSNKFLSS